MRNESAVVLLSGGQDSATCLAIALTQCRSVKTLCFDYGQRHRIEIDCAKKLAEKFSVKLDIKKLKKLARSELKKATKGLKGEEKKAAIEEAKKKGVNKLLSEILLKLPKVKGAKDKAEAKKIRKAKKKKILDALSVEVVEIKDADDQKCLTFKVTLPAKVCAKSDGSKALVLAGQEISIMGLEIGESVTVELPVKIVGLFKQFFGEENKKGKLNGKTTMELTLINTAPVE